MIISKILGRIELMLAKRWLNPFATLYLNLRCLPIRQAIKFPVFVYGRPTFLQLTGSIEFDCPVSPGMVEFNNSHPEAPSYQGCQSELFLRGRIIFHGRGQIDTGTKVYVANDAVLEVGKCFKITDMINIGCFRRIVLGDYTRVAHRSQIFDTNYHFIANLKRGIIPTTIKPVILGNHVWVCNSSTVTGGANVPDDTIISSNSLVNKDFRDIPPYSIIGGMPAKLLSSGYRRVENGTATLDLFSYFERNSEPFQLSTMPEDYFFTT